MNSETPTELKATTPTFTLSPATEAFGRFAEEFANESDRAAVILGTAKLDSLLRQILEAHLLPCAGGHDELLDGDAPLSTLSSRINACYRLGIINATFARCLHLIRRIRNSFAHESSGVSLDSGAHVDRVRELITPFQQHGAFCWLLEEFFRKPITPAQNFRAAVALLCLRLDGRLEDTKTLMPQDTRDIVPPNWDENIAAGMKRDK